MPILDMDTPNRITIDPDVLSGKPVVRDTRIAVAWVIELLAHGWSIEEITQEYPALTAEDVYACLHYAHTQLEAERAYPLP